MGTRKKTRRHTAWQQRVAALSVVLLAAPGVAAFGDAPTGRFVVAAADLSEASRVVEELGGRVLARHPAVSTMEVSLDRHVSARLGAAPGILAVAPDEEVAHASAGGTAGTELAVGTLASIVRADTAWSWGITGAGVDVALIDTGVANELLPAGRVVDGTDVSPSAGLSAQRGLDAFGHGTHLAGIILAVAPNARVIDVKAGDHNGATSLSALVRALEWTVVNARTDGRNIKVVNLSVGAVRTATWDVLSQAVDSADRSGVLVVAAAGNRGVGAEIDAPAFYSKALAVGAIDTAGTASLSDDRVAAFSSRGVNRRVDIVAPGVGVSSTRVVGSHLDLAFPGARSGDVLFRGSGTSQASAAVSAVAALVASYRPNATPSNLKAALRSTGRLLPADPSLDQGGGVVDAAAAVLGVRSSLSSFTSTYWSITSVSMVIGNAEQVGLQGSDWQQDEWSGNRWTGNRWTGNRWTGDGWPS